MLERSVPPPRVTNDSDGLSRDSEDCNKRLPRQHSITPENDDRLHRSRGLAGKGHKSRQTCGSPVRT